MKHEDNIRLCVIIPTYNNGGTVMKVVDDVYAYCHDVIVVNDGSTDDTRQRLHACSHEITVVDYPQNRGKGHALVAGFHKALELGFTHAVTIDADGQHFASDMPTLIEAMHKNRHAIIVGNRNLTEKNMPRQNTFANKFSNFWFRLQTGIDLKDTQSGYRIYPLNHLSGLNHITSRYEAELELLVFSVWAGVEIESVPVRVYYPPEGERVSHFRPIADFARISVLNTVLCILALFHSWPVRTVFSFCFFLGLALYLTVRGFFMLTLGGKTPDNKLRYHQLLQRCSRFVINHIPGTTFDYYNPAGENFNRPAVIISNHQAHIDLMGIMMLTPKLIILTKKWVWHNPFYGIIIRYADFFPTEGIATDKLKEMVEQGYSIMVFPEGTRSADCTIQRFHRGAFFMAEELDLDILPVYIKGFGKVLPKKGWRLHRGHMSVEVMPRVLRDDPAWEKGYRGMTKAMHKRYVMHNS